MPGETDLAKMLATLAVDRRPGTFCFLSGAAELVEHAEATLHESEGLTVVVDADLAVEHGYEPDFVAAWLTLRVHSALEAVGLTAAISAALGERNIPCNVLAGYHHDHLLVPVDRADDAIEALEALSATELASLEDTQS